MSNNRRIERIRVGLVMARLPSRNRWQSHYWKPVGLWPVRDDLPEWTPIPGDEQHFYAGARDIMLHHGDTAVYKDNLESPAPSVWAVFRRGGTISGWQLHLVTVDPTEAHAHVDVGDDLVEALPMPQEIAAQLAAFVTLHHVERKHWKRQRDEVDPEVLARGGRDAGT